ncbi:MAG: alpha-L-rhamnosidase-related protein [Chloroflexota bacterium]
MAANRQELIFDSIRLAKVQDDDVLYFISGKKMYEIGEVSGKYPPIGWRRPGFLAGKRISEVGPEDPRRPETAAHLLREMGGIWAHPVKAIESLYFSIQADDDHWLLSSSSRFVNHFSFVEFVFERNGLKVTRTDFVHEDEPILFINLNIANLRNTPVLLQLRLDVEFNLMPSWFSGWANGEDVVFYKDGLLFAYDKYWSGQWGVVCGSNLQPSSYLIDCTIDDPKVPTEKKRTHSLEYDLRIGSRESITVPFLVSAENRRGYPAAHDRFNRWVGNHQVAMQDKITRYQMAILDGVRFECSESWFAKAYQVAKANLKILMADLRPFVGPYLLAGIPEYVQLFGTDTCYSIPGIVSVGFHDVAREALFQLGSKAGTQCGRVPHEVTTNGRIFHPGNTQETSQFAMANWEYFKWSGDRSYLEWVYPLCQEGVLDYSPAHWDTDLDYYLDGNGVVERPGMGDEKLDVVVYFCRALFVLADMAEVLGYVAERQRYLELARLLREAINEDWWMEEESLFADSLEEDHTQKLDGHWIVATPMEADIADLEKGVRALQRIENDWVNEWGLVHTREKEELVWTLPTGVLAVAEFNYGNADRGTWLIRQIARTMEFSALGTFKELIPEGLSFVQLWSPAMFLQGVIEGIFGLDPRAYANKIALRPKLPNEWSYARLKNLKVGGHELSVDLANTENGLPRQATLVHHGGDAELTIQYDMFVDRDVGVATPAGRTVAAVPVNLRGGRAVRLEFELAPQHQVKISLDDGQITVSKPRRVRSATARPRARH